jgi:hypothetical protein
VQLSGLATTEHAVVGATPERFLGWQQTGATAVAKSLSRWPLNSWYGGSALKDRLGMVLQFIAVRWLDNCEWTAIYNEFLITSTIFVL